jgi:cytochrome c-type biogenesis protein CcmH
MVANMPVPRAVIIVLVALAACSRPADPAQDLERRILAPCCYRQTLEDHESEIAHALRLEIHRRLDAHEPAQAIEDDLVRRYGSAVLAMPSGENPRGVLGLVLAAAIALGGLAVWRIRARSSQASRATATRAPVSADHLYADRLADELIDVD